MVVDQRTQGLFFIVAGIGLAIFALGDLLFKLAMGLFAFKLVQYGLQMRGLRYGYGYRSSWY